MAYTTQNPVTTALAGAVLTLAAPPGVGAGNGDAVPANSILWIKNANASPLTVTINMQATLDGGTTVANKVVTVPATTNMLIGPFTQNMKSISGTTTGYVLIDFSSVTSVTRAYIATPW